MKPTGEMERLSIADAHLENELREMAHNWSPEKRRLMAIKLARWARQLRASANAAARAPGAPVVVPIPLGATDTRLN